MSAMAFDLQRASLEWLGRQRGPRWGGHLARGEPVSDPDMRLWIEAGIIEAVDQPQRGYVLTEKGRRFIGWQ
jgi:hypothetical protein